jgi:putative serine protease PepD
VLREDGYVVTNEHVIAGAENGAGQVTVVFSDGSEELAEIVGSTADYDLAVLRVERSGLAPLVLGDSDALLVGEPVIAIGAPLGLDGTVTTGIVSALDRPVSVSGQEGSSFINAIQTDAAINLGNSGGPLVNAAGEVIGVNSAIAAAPGGEAGSIGLGFAIPSTQVRRTAQQLIDTGTATYPIIGAVLDSRYRGEGVQVISEAADGAEPITPGGPADEAGLSPGDVIVAMDDRPVTSPDELIVRIRAHAPGDVITLTVREDGQEREVDVTLGEQESE